MIATLLVKMVVYLLAEAHVKISAKIYVRIPAKILVIRHVVERINLIIPVLLAKSVVLKTV